MDFPKLFEEKKNVKKKPRISYGFMAWMLGLVVLLLIARQITLSTPIETSVFAPRLVPNDSVTYNDSSIIKTTQPISEFPDNLGSSRKLDRLLRTVNTSGDQKYYIFASDTKIVESFRFSRDFLKIKYLSGTNYAFRLTDGVYLNNNGATSTVYFAKTGESIEDFEYDSSERSFYVLIKQQEQLKILRIGAYGEQEMYLFKNQYTSPSRFLSLNSEQIVIRDATQSCVVISTTQKIEEMKDCNTVRKNSAGLNFVVKDNAVLGVNVDTKAENVVYIPVEGQITNILQNEDQFSAIISREVISFAKDNFIYVSPLDKTLKLPIGYSVSDFYVVGQVVYITNGKSLFAWNTELPVSAPQSSWQQVVNSSDIITSEFAY